MIDVQAVGAALTRVCDQYERTAPTVHAWADDLFVRLSERPDDVRLSELTMAADLATGEVGPNVAANAVYKLMHRLGRDTTGHAGF